MKKINKRFLLILLLFSVLCSLPQYILSDVGSIRKDIQSNSYNTNTQLNISRPATSKSKKVSKIPEYVLYRNVIRRNLWLEGQGEPISQELADMLPCYFRLSMKNNKGHYQFVEALCRGELTSSHTVSPYILDKKIISPEDTVINQWDAKFSTIGQWLITSDLEGDKVVEERAFEAKSNNANLIYAFQPIYNDVNHVTGSYTDSWGLPIDVDPSDDHFYGSVVYITLNSHGLDSIVDHIDAKGLCRYNEYGVDQTRYRYDYKNRLISVSSHNTVGDPVNDNRGFCATTYEYDDENNNCIITHLDKNMNPILPIASAPEYNFIKALFKFDSVGRLEEVKFLD